MGFNLGSYAYAISCENVVEVIPLIEFRPLPGAPEYVTGIFDYRGSIVPTIDLKMLSMKTPCSQTFGTRIIVIDYPSWDGNKRRIGIAAENVTTTFTAGENDFENSGVDLKNAPYLGKIVRHDGELVQLISVENLIAPEVQELIFAKR